MVCYYAVLQSVFNEFRLAHCKHFCSVSAQHLMSKLAFRSRLPPMVSAWSGGLSSNLLQQSGYSRKRLLSRDGLGLSTCGRAIGVCQFHTSSYRPSSKLSYFHSPSTLPFQSETIGQLLNKRAELHPDKVSTIFYIDQVTLTFADLLDKADSFAAALQDLGLKTGDRIGIWGPNCVEWVITQYAAARGGFILVNINPAYRSLELEYALKKVKCRALVAAVGLKDVDYRAVLSEIAPNIQNSPSGEPVHLSQLPDLEYIIMMGDEAQPGCFKFDEVLGSATPTNKMAIKDLQDSLQFDDPVNIQFTSGTTGSPKGVTLTHHNIINNSYYVGLGCGYHEHETVVCIPVPLYHCFGMVLGGMQVLTHGATTVFPSKVFSAEAVLKAVEATRSTSLYGVPTMFIDILHHPLCDTTDTSSLVTGIMAGSPCPIETMKESIKRLNVTEITVCYGSTETSPVSFQTPRDAPVEKRVSTVGIVNPHVEAKVVDTDGRVVPVGTSGELCTRGYNTMMGYWNDPERTTECICPAGWYHTGDLAVMTEDGYCSIVGRIKDMLIKGGENVYPLEIEQVLYKHPKIKDIQVIGVPDKRLGEEVCAWVQVKEGEQLTQEEIQEFCKDKMARVKIPRYFIFGKDFPMTVTGKIQKFVMREQSVELLKL